MRVRVERTFDAATSLPGHDRCEALHGHTYRVEMMVSGEPKDGVLVDFRELKQALQELLKDYDHKDLSQKFEFPSCETICFSLCRELAAKVPGFEMLRIWEGEGKWVEMDAAEAVAHA
jgi:6-pyruvoyltetrahydropterin/6-carboxytetrahydropterin synthase